MYYDDVTVFSRILAQALKHVLLGDVTSVTDRQMDRTNVKVLIVRASAHPPILIILVFGRLLLVSAHQTILCVIGVSLSEPHVVCTTRKFLSVCLHVRSTVKKFAWVGRDNFGGLWPCTLRMHIKLFARGTRLSIAVH